MIAALVLALLAQAPPQRDTRIMPTSGSGTIVGIVTTDDAQPRPLRRARVTVMGTAIETPRTVISADDGSFSVTALPVGRFTVTAAKDGYVPMAYGATRQSQAICDNRSRCAARQPTAITSSAAPTNIN